MNAETKNKGVPVEEVESTVPERPGRTDAWIAISLGLASLAVLSITWRTQGLQSDESMNIYGALRMLAGERIYRDFWVYHTPGIFFLTAAIFKVFGESLFAVRMVLILATSATTSGMYLLGRKFMSRGFAAFAPALFVMLGVNLWAIGGYHWYSTFILVFCVLFIARFLEDRSRMKSLFAGGFLAALTFLFQQPKGGYLLFLVFPFLLAEELTQRGGTPKLRRLIRTGGVFAAGAATPIFLAAAYFALTGTLGDAVSATIGYPLKLLSQTGGEKGYGDFYGNLTHRTLSQLAGVLPLPGNGAWAAAVASWLIDYVAPLSIFVAAGAWLFRRLKGKETNAIAALCSVAALAAYGSALQRPDFFHLLTIAPPCYVTLAYVIHCISGTAEEGKSSQIRRVAGLALACVIALSCARILAGDLIYASRLETVSLGSRLGFRGLPKSMANAGFSDPLVTVIDYIQLNTAEDDAIFAMSYSPFIYYLSERRNPTPYLDIPSSPCMGATFHVFKLGHASFNLERLEDTARALEADKTPIVILDPAAACQMRDEWEEAGNEDEPLIKYIKSHYTIEADLGDYVIMRRAD
jgi:4-amino-4-deoxy-L-arabinose transferase-like glycosyltransferase